MTAEQRAKSAEAREAKLAGLHDTLAEQVAQLASGEQWQQWLDVASRFHSYSFNNTVLLLAQNPAATQVAGYQLWQQLGRQVSKGERGLSILAPVTRKTDVDPDTKPAVVADASTTPATAATSAATGTSTGTGAAAAGARSSASSSSSAPSGSTSTPDDARKTRRVVGYRPVYVWDITQTTGDPLPQQPRPVLLAGQAPDGLWDALQAQCEQAGFTVSRDPLAGDDGPNGYTDYATHSVVVRSDVDDAQAVKTLAHELGHVLLHDPDGFTDGQTRSCRGTGEVEAESLAYLVAADHGLDTSTYSFAYVAGWAASSAGTVHDAEALERLVRATGARVLTAAHQVLEASHDHLDAAAAVPASDSTTAALTQDAPVDDLGAQLTARAAAGAERTATLHAAATQPAAHPAAAGAPAVLEHTAPDRLLAANAEASAFFTGQYGQWVPDYLQERLRTRLTMNQRHGIGYAPNEWTALVDHLHREGFTDREILDAGLGIEARTGRVVDRFRDRLMFPVRARIDAGATGASTAGGSVATVAFVGRRNPSLDLEPDTSADGTVPKYLNTPQTAIWTKGEHLYGMPELATVVAAGGRAVLVEGPIDRLAVDLAGRHGSALTDERAAASLVGVAALGTAITDQHAAALAATLGHEHADQLVVATDGDTAGLRAAQAAYDVLTAHNLDPHVARLPAGLDPAALYEHHGADALTAALADTIPLSRHLVNTTLADAGLAGGQRHWAEDEIHARTLAARVIVKAPSSTWPREIAAAAAAHGLDRALLTGDVVAALNTGGDDAVGRTEARAEHDGRADRGPGTARTDAPAIASLSSPRTLTLRPPTLASLGSAAPGHVPAPAVRATGRAR